VGGWSGLLIGQWKNGRQPMNQQKPPGRGGDSQFRGTSVDAKTFRGADAGLQGTRAGQSKGLSQLVAEIYELAPPDVRVKMLEHLMRPLGVLALVAVANGAFAKIRLRSGLYRQKLSVDDLPGIKAGDIISLVDSVERVNERTVNGLVHLLRSASETASTPDFAHSRAATLLATTIEGRYRGRSDRRWDAIDSVLH